MSNKCVDCDKTFTTRSSLARHMEKYCKKEKIVNKTPTTNNNPTIDQADIKVMCQTVAELTNTLKDVVTAIQKHGEQIKELTKIISNNQCDNIKSDKHISNSTLTKCNSTSKGDININKVKNINNDIKVEPVVTISPKPDRVFSLVEYGKETMKNIPVNDVKRIFRSGYKADVNMFSYIHFNPMYPEYLNLRVDNKKEKYLSFYNGDAWNHGLKRTMIDEIYSNIIDMLTDTIDGFPDAYKSLSNPLKNALDNVTNYSDTDKRVKDAKDTMLIMMYDNKNLVLRNYNDLQKRGFVNRCSPDNKQKTQQITTDKSDNKTIISTQNDTNNDIKNGNITNNIDDNDDDTHTSDDDINSSVDQKLGLASLSEDGVDIKICTTIKKSPIKTSNNTNVTKNNTKIITKTSNKK